MRFIQLLQKRDVITQCDFRWLDFDAERKKWQMLFGFFGNFAFEAAVKCVELRTQKKISVTLTKPRAAAS